MALFRGDYAQGFERFYTAKGKYVFSGTTCGIAPDSTEFYTITASCSTASSFTHNATPKAGTTQANDGELEIDNTGKRVMSTWSN